MPFVCTDLTHFLDATYQDSLVAVEFECGSLCKKAVGVLTCIAPDFVRLAAGAPPNDFVRVSIFFGTDCPIEECAREIVIKKCKIISVELLPETGTCP